MEKYVSHIRKIVILLIGLPLLVLGIILIPLPGPGLLVCFAALFLLSMEFEWAEKHLARVKKDMQRVIDKATDKSERK